jgi:aminopeptidase N
LFCFFDKPIDSKYPYLSFLQFPEPNTDYVVSIDFVAILNDDKSGFYRTKYTKPDGNISWVGATQFESTGARKSFPCFDEPDKKAIFNVKLGRRPDMTAVSNMPLVKTNESFIFQNQGRYTKIYLDITNFE